MQLKKINLCGFKSFADKTEFSFEPGVTVIVGPNGCGKSNVVDAVKWVLGEQSAKSLRGGQMLDVIFNGSNSRKSLGLAEVTLTFSNTKGLLHTDLDEIAVTRKLYRSGDSEYLLNNKPCRLKDIREMFMDTGIGADAYSIIEQGKVEVLLQSSKQDRRAIFEEAAGISKYKTRKKEAERKLERTEQNLLRLNDLIGELEKQLRSIKYQAGKARNYQSYTERLKELRLNQFLVEYRQLQQQTEQIGVELEQAQQDIAETSAALQQTHNRISLVDHDLDQADRDIRQHENQLLQCTSQISTQQDRIDFGHQRCKELQQTIENARQQIRELQQQISQLNKQSVEDKQQIADVEQVIEEQHHQLETVQHDRQQVVLKQAEYQAQLDDEKSGLLDIVRKTAQLHNEIVSLDQRQSSLSGQKDRLSDRHGKIHSEIEGLITDRSQYDSKLKKISALLAESKSQLENKRQELAQVSDQLLEGAEQLSTAKEYRSGLMSRQQILSDLEARLEGVDKGVRQILQAKEQDPQNYFYLKNIVAELIQADVKYASLVDTALVDRAQNLVAASSQAVLEDYPNLEQIDGRIDIICLDQLPPYSNGYDFTQHPEVQAKFIDLVSFPPDCQALAWHLLGKTILVDQIDSAVRLAQVAPPGYRWITLNGEVLEPDGTIRLGPQKAQIGLISRKSELRQIEVNLTEADERIRTIQNQNEQFQSQAQHLERNLQELRTVIYENNTEEIETRSRIEQIDGNLNRLKQEQPLIASEMTMLEQQITESAQHRQANQQDLDNLQTVNEQRQQHVDELESAISALSRQDDEIQEQITEIKVQLGQYQQKKLALSEKINQVNTQIHQCQHNMQTRRNELDHGRQSVEDTERSILTAESRIAELFHVRQQSQEQTQTLRDRRTDLVAEKQQLDELLAEQSRKKEQAQQQEHEIQLARSENKIRNENLTEKARTELDMDLAEQSQSHDVQQMDWDAVAEEVNDLRRKIERLGNVNLDAITEQEELEKRAGELSSQLADLQDSKHQLEQLILKINKQSIELFRSNFETIRENFIDLFRKLFGGGRADILLEDPDNILDCGIEIIARPPGKQLQSISLMSGGEKTMTAVALLLAIFKSKPSPFCLLDEVDAALDEANNERFNMVVQDFLTESQFVIITHSRRTMSIGDILYGVTMQEQGVSKKVAVKFDDRTMVDEPEPDTAVA